MLTKLFAVLLHPTLYPDTLDKSAGTGTGDDTKYMLAQWTCGFWGVSTG
jgi:hypothetical protein